MVGSLGLQMTSGSHSPALLEGQGGGAQVTQSPVRLLERVLGIRGPPFHRWGNGETESRGKRGLAKVTPPIKEPRVLGQTESFSPYPAEKQKGKSTFLADEGN